MYKTKVIVKKILVLLVGIPLLVLGIILIPLPGPGLIVTFLALLILSLEFEWAQKKRLSVQAALKKIIDEAMMQYREEKRRYDEDKNSK